MYRPQWPAASLRRVGWLGRSPPPFEGEASPSNPRRHRHSNRPSTIPYTAGTTSTPTGDCWLRSGGLRAPIRAVQRALQHHVRASRHVVGTRRPPRSSLRSSSRASPKGIATHLVRQLQCQQAALGYRVDHARTHGRQRQTSLQQPSPRPPTATNTCQLARPADPACLHNPSCLSPPHLLVRKGLHPTAGDSTPLAQSSSRSESGAIARPATAPRRCEKC